MTPTQSSIQVRKGTGASLAGLPDAATKGAA